MNLGESIAAQQGSNQPSFFGSTRYEVPDNPDMLIEIADWDHLNRHIGETCPAWTALSQHYILFRLGGTLDVAAQRYCFEIMAR
jgi:hypothetical protein